MSAYDSTDFQQDVIERSNRIPVLVDFWAEWCGPCRILGPTLERLAEKHAGSWELKKVDTEAYPEVAARYGIRSIPTVKLFVNGTPVEEFVGALPEPAIEQWFQKALPDPHASALATAKVLKQEGKDEEARRMFESILAQSPAHEEARTFLAMSLFFQDRSRALELIGDLDTGGVTGERINAMRTLDQLIAPLENEGAIPDAAVKPLYISALSAILKQEFDCALERLISIIKSDRYYNEDSARKACIAIFKYLGEDHPITLQYRREFDRSLY